MDVFNSNFLSSAQSKLTTFGGVSLILGVGSLVTSSLGLGILTALTALFPEAAFLSVAASAIAGVSLFSTLALPLAIASGVLLIFAIIAFIYAGRKEPPDVQVNIQRESIGVSFESDDSSESSESVAVSLNFNKPLTSILASPVFKNFDYSEIEIEASVLDDWAESAEYIYVKNPSLLIRLATHASLSKLKIALTFRQDDYLMLALIFINPEYLEETPQLEEKYREYVELQCDHLIDDTFELTADFIKNLIKHEGFKEFDFSDVEISPERLELLLEKLGKKSIQNQSLLLRLAEVDRDRRGKLFFSEFQGDLTFMISICKINVRYLDLISRQEDNWSMEGYTHFVHEVPAAYCEVYYLLFDENIDVQALLEKDPTIYGKLPFKDNVDLNKLTDEQLIQVVHSCSFNPIIGLQLIQRLSNFELAKAVAAAGYEINRCFEVLYESNLHHYDNDQLLELLKMSNNENYFHFLSCMQIAEHPFLKDVDQLIAYIKELEEFNPLDYVVEELKSNEQLVLAVMSNISDEQQIRYIRKSGIEYSLLDNQNFLNHLLQDRHYLVTGLIIKYPEKKDVIYTACPSLFNDEVLLYRHLCQCPESMDVLDRYINDEFKNDQTFMLTILMAYKDDNRCPVDFFLPLILTHSSFFLEALPYLSKENVKNMVALLPFSWRLDSEFAYDFIYTLNQMYEGNFRSCIDVLERNLLDLLSPRIVAMYPNWQYILGDDERTMWTLSRSSILDSPLECLEVFSEKIDENQGRLPKICFEGESGVDYGGLTNDFISTLFDALFSGKYPAIGECNPYPKINDVISSQQFEWIGKVMGALIVENPHRCTTGQMIDRGFFNALSELSLEELLQDDPSPDAQ